MAMQNRKPMQKRSLKTRRDRIKVYRTILDIDSCVPVENKSVTLSKYPADSQTIPRELVGKHATLAVCSEDQAMHTALIKIERKFERNYGIILDPKNGEYIGNCALYDAKNLATGCHALVRLDSTLHTLHSREELFSRRGKMKSFARVIEPSMWFEGDLQRYKLPPLMLPKTVTYGAAEFSLFVAKRLKDEMDSKRKELSLFPKPPIQDPAQLYRIEKSSYLSSLGLNETFPEPDPSEMYCSIVRRDGLPLSQSDWEQLEKLIQIDIKQPIVHISHNRSLYRFKVKK